MNAKKEGRNLMPLDRPEQRLVVEFIKSRTVTRTVVRRCGVSPAVADRYGAFDESAIDDQEKDKFFEDFCRQALRDPYLFRKGAER